MKTTDLIFNNLSILIMKNLTNIKENDCVEILPFPWAQTTFSYMTSSLRWAVSPLFVVSHCLMSCENSHVCISFFFNCLFILYFLVLKHAFFCTCGDYLKFYFWFYFYITHFNLQLLLHVVSYQWDIYFS